MHPFLLLLSSGSTNMREPGSVRAGMAFTPNLLSRVKEFVESERERSGKGEGQVQIKVGEE